MKNQALQKFLIILGVTLFWLVVWQLISLAINSVIILASPLQVAEALFELIQVLSFWLAVFSSLLRVVSGFLLALFFGTALAFLCYFFKVAEWFIKPIILLFKTVPVAALTILIFFWISGKEISVIVSFIMVMPIFFVNIYNGLKATDIKMLQMADTFKLKTHKKIKFIYFPQIKSFFIAATSSGIGIAWKSAIAAEIIAQPKDTIGYNINTAKIYLEMPEVFAWTAVVIVLSLLMEFGIKRLLKFWDRKKNDSSEKHL
ncbi:MAG: ABC transporter permease subunit [Firmicutes bacterium]|nr:ABC transporter permease subunit [Bacillota bacterium]